MVRERNVAGGCVEEGVMRVLLFFTCRSSFATRLAIVCPGG